ncbi:MAG TPA: protocatechuate 3,4-dioxygenase [Burkholderiales bacterium]|jgi:protocatechuate 3,4-dioxygenase beta subunit
MKKALIPASQQPSRGNLVTRRRFVGVLAVGLASVRSSRSLAETRISTPRQTEGPFYPDRLPLDRDNDLLRVGERTATARGRETHLRGRIVGVDGAPLSGALVEIWQVDANGVYLHSADRHARRDAGFQGYGRYLTDASGEYFFRTIKPVPYPGRTPHIHFKVTPVSRATFTTQCYVQGEPLNARDAVLNSIGDPAARALLIVPFVPVSESPASVLNARFDIVLA